MYVRIDKCWRKVLHENQNTKIFVDIVVSK